MKSKISPSAKVQALLTFAAAHVNIAYETPDQKNAIRYAIEIGNLQLVIQLHDAGAQIAQAELALAQGVQNSPPHQKIVEYLQRPRDQKTARLPYHIHHNLILEKHRRSTATLISYTDSMKSLEFERGPVRNNWSEQQRFGLFVDYATGFNHYDPRQPQNQLNYSHQGLYGDHVLWIALGKDLKKESPVSSLTFDGNSIIKRGSFGIEQLSGIRSLFKHHALSGNVDTISLEHCQLNDEALHCIGAQLTEHTRLKKLILSHNAFTDKAVLAFKDRLIELKLNGLQVEIFGADISEHTKIILRKFSTEQLKNQALTQLKNAVHAALNADLVYQKNQTQANEAALRQEQGTLESLLNLQTVWDPIHYSFRSLELDVEGWIQAFYQQERVGQTKPFDRTLQDVFTGFKKEINDFYQRSNQLSQALMNGNTVQFLELMQSDKATYVNYIPNENNLNQSSLYHLAFERLRANPNDAELQKIVEHLLPSIPFDIEHTNAPEVGEATTALQAFLQRKTSEPKRTETEYLYQKKLLKILINHFKQTEMGKSSLRALWVLPPTRIEIFFNTLRNQLEERFAEWDKDSQAKAAGKLETQLINTVANGVVRASFSIKGITGTALVTGILTAASIKLDIANPILGVLTFIGGLLIYGAAKYAHSMTRDAVLPVHWMDVPDSYTNKAARAVYIAHKFVQRFGIMIENSSTEERSHLSDIFVRRLGHIYRKSLSSFHKHRARILTETTATSAEELLDGLLSIVCDQKFGSGWGAQFDKANHMLSETPIACVDEFGNITEWHMEKAALDRQKKSHLNKRQEAEHAFNYAKRRHNALQKHQGNDQVTKARKAAAESNREAKKAAYEALQGRMCVHEYQIVQQTNFSDDTYPKTVEISTPMQPITYWWDHYQHAHSSESDYQAYVAGAQKLRGNVQDERIEDQNRRIDEQNKQIEDLTETVKELSTSLSLEQKSGPTSTP